MGKPSSNDDMKEDMLTLPKGTIPSKQIMTRFQNRLKAKRWIFQSRCPYSPAIRKPIGNYEEYKKSHKCKACLCPAKRLWAWHSFDSLWVLIKPINGGFRSGIPVSILPESGFLETRISKKAQRELFKGFIRALEKQGALVEEFDEGLWSSLVQEVVVKSKDDILFIFKNGFKIKMR